MNPRLFNDAYCESVCGMAKYAWCDQSKCRCTKTSKAWDLSAPIQAHDDTLEPKDLPKREGHLKQQVKKDWHDQPSGLPACRWRPGPGCNNTTQYECVDGAREGQCS